MSGLAKSPLRNRTALIAATALTFAAVRPAIAQTEAVTPPTLTKAGTEITLQATVTYNSATGSANGTAIKKVKVDRLVDMKWNEYANGSGSYTDNLQRNRIGYALVELSNYTNDDTDFRLSIKNADSTKATPEAKLYIDQNNNSSLDIGTDTAVGSLSRVPHNAQRKLLLAITIPDDAVNGSTYEYYVTAQAYAAGAVNVVGSTPLDAGTNITDNIFTVLGDKTSEPTDKDYDGKVIEKITFTVKMPVLTPISITKIIEDPLEGEVESAVITGSKLQYCIGWANAENAGPAYDIKISSVLPNSLTLNTTSVKPGEYVDSKCEPITLNKLTVAADNKFEQPLPDIQPGKNGVVIFEATVN